MSAPSTTSLTVAERRARLRLIRSETIGPITFWQLFTRFGSGEAALEALPELARRAGRKALRIATATEADVEMARLAALGARLVAPEEEGYPPLLAEIEDAPPLLAVKGDLTLLARPWIAMVGSRNASLAGRRFARDLARDLGQAGWVVVSGLARGIDGAAHEGALPAGTAAAIAGGIDVTYPPEHAALQEAIAERGLLLAEMPPGTQPQARHFPRRNRLISGSARGVVVIEATLHSGSLITARLALEQGREVFAVPGSPLDPRARGGNDLLRQGAILVEGVADVLAAVPDGTASQRPAAATGAGKAAQTAQAAVCRTALARADQPQANVAAAPPCEGVPAGADGPEDEDAARALIAATLSSVPLAVDDIVRNCHLSPAVVATILLEWELAGRLERHPGNRVAFVATSEGA